MTPSHSQTVIDGLYRDVERRIAASPPGLCPVDLAKSFLDLCHAQTCGKCVPCRIGLGQLSELMEQVLEGEATMETISIIERMARVIVNSADCAIGRDAARLVLDGVQGFRDDYEEHILRHRCLGGMREPVPCVALCPAGVDIPGYLVLIKYGRYADAVRLIRKDNPFPSACAYICEHPCEARCRRNMIDDAVNIRGLKRYAVDNAGYVPQPDCAEPTGKKIAVIGGGPSGLSAAYYLALMGHKVTVYEKRAKLGGMLRYGIPNYRLPREVLDAEIASMLALGIDVHVNVNVGDDVTFDELRQQNDALYIALGAHTDKKTGIEGEDADGVISAVEMLREIGDDHMPDFRNKDIVVIGGGNFFRGAELQQRGMERARGDYMSMLGTVMNCLALQDFLEREHEIDTRVMTAITMGQVAEPYIPRRASRHMEKGRVVIFGAGTGMPYFSTDTAAAQRALEIGCEVVLMAKGVNGVYTADPKTDPAAELFERISHREVLERGLKVADATAFSLCMDNHMPILVFNLLQEGNIARAVGGEKIGTLVSTPAPPSA